MTVWLIDTGPLVAYLDGGDPDHPAVCRCLDGFAGALATTGAVVTEAMHLVASDRRGPRLLTDLLAEARVEVYDFTRPPDLHHATALMEEFLSLPMDFADATLLLLAEGLGVDDLLTLDRRGFAAFRTRQGRPLRLVLDLS